jgi:hypothetical protein
MPAAPVRVATTTAAAAAAPKPKKLTLAKPARKVIECDGDKYWFEQFSGDQILVRCSDNIAFNTDGEGLGTWDDKTKTVIENDESDDEE